MDVRRNYSLSITNYIHGSSFSRSMVHFYAVQAKRNRRINLKSFCTRHSKVFEVGQRGTFFKKFPFAYSTYSSAPKSILLSRIFFFGLLTVCLCMFLRIPRLLSMRAVVQICILYAMFENGTLLWGLLSATAMR